MSQGGYVGQIADEEEVSFPVTFNSMSFALGNSVTSLNPARARSLSKTSFLATCTSGGMHWVAAGR